MLMNTDQYYRTYHENNEIAAWMRAERIAFCEQPMARRGKGIAGAVMNIVNTFLSLLF